MTVFINEIHYDNTGADVNEAIEIAGTAGTDLTGYRLVLYNGSVPGAAVVYGTINLSGVIDNESNGFGALTFLAPGLQNGGNDGFALIAPDGTVIQLLSYEGVFTAAAGTPAAGMVSTDIGVSEPGTEAATFSLQARGTGTTAADFTFAAGSASSFGSINSGQSFVAAPQPGVLSIADASIVEGNSGTSPISFVVSRTGGTSGAVSAAYTLSFGTANAADFASGTVFTGTVNFADGQNSATIIFNVAGDTVIEPDEGFTVTLSAPTGGVTIGDGVASGAITNDDVAPVGPANIFINEIHYDNSGADANEAIEVAGTAGLDLTGYRLVLYNGSTTPGAAVVYATINLSGVIDDEGQGFGALSFNAVGLQNGVADGIALIAPNGTVVQLLSYEGVFTAAAGTPAAGIVSTDIGVSEDGTGSVTASLQATGTGGAAADFRFQPDAPSSFGTLNVGQTFIGPNGTGQVSIGDASVIEGDSGVQQIVFTVRRGGGSGQSASVNYSVNFDGTATTDDFAAGLLTTGTVTFGVGESVRQIIIGVNGDTFAEGNETFSIALSNPVGNIIITDGNAIGTITNDDPIALAIYQIQGESHRSAVTGQTVITTGIVTAVDTNGFYLQDATGDGNARTSDALFVLTTTAPTVVIGDSVNVRGQVQEFLPGNNPDNLTTTQIALSTVSVLSSGNALPAAVLIGTGGLLPPSAVFEDDGFTSFDPLTDAADFYESLEGMRVTIDAPLVTSGTNSFGETQVVASGGVGATGVNARGGITVGSDSRDFNPERIQIDDDAGIFAGFVPNFGQGDRLTSVTGVVSYNFSTYEVLVTEAVGVAFDAPAPTREVTDVIGTADRLSIATYNLENLDPTDTKFDILARDIALNLRGPDILAVQEIQDADGAGTGGNLSGTVTANLLISAISRAGGPNYAYVEVAPTTPNSTGGEPNGNIRNGFFYNVDRVSYIANSAVAVPGSAFNGSRQPLAAQFVFNDQTITAISVHSTSRGGSDPLFGATQPPADAGDGARTAQATALRAFINTQLAGNPAANIAVLGDFNGFTFENAIGTLEAGGALTDLNRLLAPEERYSFVFDGNAQALDHILVTAGLAANAQYDAIHLNSEQPDTPARGTDHDPQIASFLIARPNLPPVAVGDVAAINEDGTTGNLTALLLGNDSDPDPGSVLRITAVDDSATLGSLIFDPISQSLRYVADDDSFDNLAPGATVTDRFSYTISDAGGLTSTATVTVTITGISDGITVNGTPNNDALVGTRDEDQLFGFAGNDVLNGLGANDQLFGGNGDDRLFGDEGDDRLFGDAGNDVLTGGSGSDIFGFGKTRGTDIITDFDTALDRILLINNVKVRNFAVSDVDGDGRADLSLTLTTGNIVQLLGVSDFNLVSIDRVAEAINLGVIA